MESICKLILAIYRVLIESFGAFFQKLTQYGKLMEAYFDIQYGHDGKLGRFVYDFIPYVNHMEAQFSYSRRSLSSICGHFQPINYIRKHVEA